MLGYNLKIRHYSVVDAFSAPSSQSVESAQSRLELLEQTLANLRQELHSQSVVAEQEQAQLEESLAKLLRDHQQIEISLREMERQNLAITREVENRDQELREREFALVQLRNELAERERAIELKERKLAGDVVALPAGPVLNRFNGQQQVIVIALVGTLIAFCGILAGSLIPRPAPNALPSSSIKPLDPLR